jgi:hypothetical protein
VARGLVGKVVLACGENLSRERSPFQLGWGAPRMGGGAVAIGRRVTIERRWDAILNISLVRFHGIWYLQGEVLEFQDCSLQKLFKIWISHIC